MCMYTYMDTAVSVFIMCPAVRNFDEYDPKCGVGSRDYNAVLLHKYAPMQHYFHNVQTHFVGVIHW